MQFNSVNSEDVFINNLYNIDSLEIFDTGQNKLMQLNIKLDTNLTTKTLIKIQPNWGNNISSTYLIRLNANSVDTLFIHCIEVKIGSECICTTFNYDKVELNQNRIEPTNKNSYSIKVP